VVTKDNADFHIVLVNGFVRKGDKFLLARRSTKELQAGGEWSIPGGKMEIVDGDEVVEEHLKQEILEEVGVLVSLQMKYLCSRGFTRVDGAHVMSFTFLVEYVSGEALPLEDTSEVSWFTLEELKNLSDLPKYMQGQVRSLSEFIEKNPS